MATPVTLFRREVRVIAYQAKIGQYFPEPVPGIVIERLRIQFAIERNLRGEPNRCEIAVTNANEDTRRFLATKPLVVIVEAGYEGDGAPGRASIRRIFQGDLRYAASRLDGPSWATTMQLGDGDRAYKHARVNRSYAGGTKILTVLADAAKACGLSLPETIYDDPRLAGEYAAGMAVAGRAADTLTDVLTIYGYAWSIQAGKLVVLRDEDTLPGQATVISEATGMIDSPELTAPDKGKKKPTLTVTTLLYPQVVPGGTIRVDSRSVKGDYKVERVVHTGDTHGEDFKTEIEATPI